MTEIDILDMEDSLIVTILTPKGKADKPIRLTRNEFVLLFNAMDDFLREEYD